MRVLVTGAKGFIGRNLISELKNQKCVEVFEYSRETDPVLLDKFCKEADFIFHLAGVNRPNDSSDFMEGNYGFTSNLIKKLKKYRNYCPIVFSSSVQSIEENYYGISKKASEDVLFQYNKETGAKVLVYRLPNVFGKWCKPNYNSAVSTFCHNIANDLPITIHDSSKVMSLVYIDDVVQEFLNSINGFENRKGIFCEIPVVHIITLGEIANLINSFKISRNKNSIPDMSNQLIKKLYSTYLSYLPENKFSYELKMNTDHRGSFTEFLKTIDRGQVSINVSKPGITKGNHWHHTKNEKFLVVSGKGVIRFRKIGSDKIIEYFVSDEKLEVVDIPVGYTHNIENLGETKMVTIMWANECYDPQKPDTYYLEV